MGFLRLIDKMIHGKETNLSWLQAIHISFFFSRVKRKNSEERGGGGEKKPPTENVYTDDKRGMELSHFESEYIYIVICAVFYFIAFACLPASPPPPGRLSQSNPL